jgi:hypothetical protein
MVHDKHIHRPLAGFELQSQLFRQSRIDGRKGLIVKP